MKGLLFYDYDGGRGGPDGCLAHYQTWCVEIDGKKVHIHSELTGSPGFPPERGGPTRSVRVTSCDNSCAKLAEVDEWTTRMALEQIETTDRPLASEEVEELPTELAGTSYISELVEAYRNMMNDRKEKTREIRAGRNLFSAVRSSVLRWFFKDQLAGYEKAMQ